MNTSTGRERTERDVSTIERIRHDEAMALAAAENRAFAELLRSLDNEDWSRQTDCTLWDVRAMAAHVVGSAASQVSPREFLRQKRKGKPIMAELGTPFWWDGMNELQVRERAGLSTEALISEWDTTSAKSVRARTKMPRFIANRKLLNLPPPVGKQPIAYLFDVGFTRDVWMHRIDICVAVDRPVSYDEHDRRLVEDLVAEWAGTHGEPFVLELAGPAGGVYRQGDGGEHVEIDVTEFARTLAERAHGTGVLRHPLPL